MNYLRGRQYGQFSSAISENLRPYTVWLTWLMSKSDFFIDSDGTKTNCCNVDVNVRNCAAWRGVFFFSSVCWILLKTIVAAAALDGRWNTLSNHTRTLPVLTRFSAEYNQKNTSEFVCLKYQRNRFSFDTTTIETKRFVSLFWRQRNSGVPNFAQNLMSESPSDRTVLIFWLCYLNLSDTDVKR